MRKPASVDFCRSAGRNILNHIKLAWAGFRRKAELVEKHKDRIDLLIAEVLMPAMSGPELAVQLSVARPDMIVLYVSGYTTLLHRGAIEQGTAFLQKPFLAESLLMKVDELSLAEAERSRGRFLGAWAAVSPTDRRGQDSRSPSRRRGIEPAWEESSSPEHLV